MKKILAILLILLLCGCGAEAPETTKASAPDLQAGFGMVDITPRDSVPMGSYGDDRDRWSNGLLSALEARAVALRDGEGNTIVFLTGDVSWAPTELADRVRIKLSQELGIPEDYIICSGTHTHSSVSTGLTEFPEVVRFNESYINGMVKAGQKAVEDLKPAQMYTGSVMTENMNHVRRYFMEDGSLDGDNTYGTGTKRVAHETEADREMQILRITREGGKDIVITNFQAHPHLEGKTNNLSAQTVGAIRDDVESRFDAHALHWNGCAGNLNTHSSLEGETPTRDRVEYGKLMGAYVEQVYESLTKVNAGTIRVAKQTITCNINHTYDHMVAEARQVRDYFNSGHTPEETAEYAHQFVDEKGLRINSYYHANSITLNAGLPATQEMTLYTWSVGDVAGIVVPYELFDTSGMQVKAGSPFVRTFILGYSYPSYVGYIPTEAGFANGGYEADNCRYESGTAEAMVESYLSMLNELHG